MRERMNRRDGAVGRFLNLRRGGFVAAWAVGVVLAGAAAAERPDPPIKLGIDVLEARGFDVLAGKRVGLITNPSGTSRDLRATVDVLADAPNVQLIALFGPEHGVRGEVPAGEKIADGRDEITGLPVRSLYGATRKPTPEMLADIDVLVFDVQDNGSRSYTYISTMAVAMEAAAEEGKAFVVLDRPNPCGGNRVEGRVADMEFKSFVGHLPIPYMHGMTVGELATMTNESGWLEGGVRCDLTVIPMEGWRRSMLWNDTGLLWISSSPHVPRGESSLFYATTGIVGELRTLSEGVGYPLPFELLGRPGLDPQRLANDLNARGLPGVFFQPTYFRPYYHSFEGETCGGVQIVLTDPRRAQLTPIQFHAMDAVMKMHPELAFFGGRRDNMFDKVCGTDLIRKAFADGGLRKVLTLWNEGVDEFKRARAPYLLYK